MTLRKLYLALITSKNVNVILLAFTELWFMDFIKFGNIIDNCHFPIKKKEVGAGRGEGKGNWSGDVTCEKRIIF